jgi:hypothetical protein
MLEIFQVASDETAASNSIGKKNLEKTLLKVKFGSKISQSLIKISAETFDVLSEVFESFESSHPNERNYDFFLVQLSFSFLFLFLILLLFSSNFRLTFSFSFPHHIFYPHLSVFLCFIIRKKTNLP